MTLADLVARHAATSPDKVAIRFEGRDLTYRVFAERIGLAASALARAGIGAGDRVAVLALNHPDTLVLLYACARLGAMLSPLNWRLAAPELAWIVADLEPKLLVVGPDFASLAPALAEAAPGLALVALGEGGSTLPSLDDLVRRADGDAPETGGLASPLLVVHTSGTTGRPKGAVLGQDALRQNGLMSRHMHGLTAADHVLTVLPFFHVGGLNIQTTPALHEGGTVTIHPRFDPDATLRSFAVDRPSLTVLVPATLQAVIAHPGFAAADLGSLRAVTTGSTYVPQRLVDVFEARGVPVLQVYGATETGPVAIYTRHDGERPSGSTGWPGSLCEAKLVDEAGQDLPDGVAGEIWLRGPNLLSGYWRNEAATREALRGGWFRTGDVATRAMSGAYMVHDRRKNLVISGGENIYPAEIERVLGEHPAVAEAAVVGRPDPRWGEVPVAHVVLRPGQACSEAELSAHVLGQLARFKAPKLYVFAAELPKSALGKVQHHLLRSGGT